MQYVLDNLQNETPLHPSESDSGKGISDDTEPISPKSGFLPLALLGVPVEGAGCLLLLYARVYTFTLFSQVQQRNATAITAISNISRYPVGNLTWKEESKGCIRTARHDAAMRTRMSA